MRDNGCKLSKRQSGFSLLELSIVMIIVGILVSVGIGMLGPGLIEATNIKTDKYLHANVQALVGTATATRTLASATTYTNIIPWLKDGANADFLYLYDNRLTTTQALCSQTSTYLTLVTPAGATISNVAFILFSRGFNGTIAKTAGNDWATAGPVTATTTYTMQNYVADKISTPRNNTWDDIAEWATLSQLQTAAGCKPLQIVTNALPAAATGTSYHTVVSADGGSGNYMWCVTASGTVPANMTFSGEPTTQTCAGLSLTDNDRNELTISSGTDYPSAGSAVLTFTVWDKQNTSLSVSKTLTLNGSKGLSIVTTSLPQGASGSEYRAVVNADGGSGNYMWCIRQNGTMSLTVQGEPTTQACPAGGTQLTITDINRGEIFISSSSITSGSVTLTFYVWDTAATSIYVYRSMTLYVP